MARRFNQEASNLPDSIVVMTISADLPFAQTRFCGVENTDKIEVLSDHLELAFGKAYGTYVPALRVNSRAVFVVDKNDKITHLEYVPNIPDHPNYDQALTAARSADA
jgi:thiol peroxidase